MTATRNPRLDYFEAIAPRWDSLVGSERMRCRLGPILDGLGIGAEEHILDLGCGTGILAGLLLPRLSGRGRVSALDYSRAMLDVARARFSDPRIRWTAADAAAIPLRGASVDRAIAFSSWPHFPDAPSVLGELARTVRPGGWFHIIHTEARATINAIHAGAAGAIGADLLPPAGTVAAMLPRFGFQTAVAEDDGDRYVVSALRRAGP